MRHLQRQIRVGVGVAFGFAAGAVLASAVLEGTMGWAETASVGLLLMVGGVVGFAIGCPVGCSLGERLTVDADACLGASQFRVRVRGHDGNRRRVLETFSVPMPG